MPARQFLVLSAAFAFAATAAHAEDETVLRIEFQDGKVMPARIEAPAKTRLKLDLVNLGDTPAEFESKPLRLERVLAPKGHGTLIIRTLDPGEYEFFDDFHPDAAPATIVVK
jgi:hypothetical protein